MRIKHTRSCTVREKIKDIDKFGVRCVEIFLQMTAHELLCEMISSFEDRLPSAGDDILSPFFFNEEGNSD